ncbi:MAG TPA: aromatic-ring-hydroxylating dioxygenase subunit beta [Polyangiales bacterium]|nr:aromatic-ring-hydroxylating dioxygenase subunit beta [Polyangiales bacterium]
MSSLGGELLVHERRAIAAELVYRGAAHLDERNWAAWLALATDDFHYRIVTHSPEIKKQMVWLEHDRQGLEALFALLHKHHSDHALWLRQLTLQQVEQPTRDELYAISQLVIYATELDVGDAHVESGSTRIFAVGRYRDRLRRENGSWLLAARDVQLDTRQVGIGTHNIL